MSVSNSILLHLLVTLYLENCLEKKPSKLQVACFDLVTFDSG